MSKTKDQKEANLKKILKNIGKCVFTGKEIYEEKKNLKTLSIGPSLDFALNGGVQEGSWLKMTGLPKSGKTSTALQIAANAQAEGRKVIYLDAEGRIKSHNLDGIEGLDLDKMEIIRSSEDKIFCAEEFLSLLETMIVLPENEGALVIIDSLSSLIPLRDLESVGVDGERRPGLPKILGDFTKRMGQVIPRTKTIVLMIGHLITNTSGYGKKHIEDGGLKIQYQADTMMQVKRSDPWIVGQQKIGQIITWTIGTSSLGASGTEAVSYFRYGKGLDQIKEIIEIAEDFDIVEKSGAWYTLSYMEKHDKEYDEKKYKFQGVDNLYNYLSENPEDMNYLKQEVEKYRL